MRRRRASSTVSASTSSRGSRLERSRRWSGLRARPSARAALGGIGSLEPRRSGGRAGGRGTGRKRRRAGLAPGREHLAAPRGDGAAGVPQEHLLADAGGWFGLRGRRGRHRLAGGAVPVSRPPRLRMGAAAAAGGPGLRGRLRLHRPLGFRRAGAGGSAHADGLGLGAGVLLSRGAQPGRRHRHAQAWCSIRTST